MPSSVQNHRPALGYFVLGSLVLHTLLVGLWQGEAPAGPSARSTFKITLLARHGDGISKTDNSSKPRPENNNHPTTHGTISSSGAERPEPVEIPNTAMALQLITETANKRLPTNRPNSVAQETSAKTPVEEISPRTVQAKPLATNIDVTSIREQINTASGSVSHGQHELTIAARNRRVHELLKAVLLPRFDYPPLAWRRGWQGRVKVGMHVEADGDLTGIHLVESSGYALLDKATIRSVNELRNAPGITQLIDARGMDVVLPVRYRLDDR